MNPMRLKKYEIRMSISKNLYERISQEAKYRDTKMANIAREKLAKHFFQHATPTTSFALSENPQENQINNITQTPLMSAEKQLFSVISKIEKQFEFTQEQMKFIITMLDRFYFDLMKFLPAILDKLALAAISMAHQRHREWLKEVEKLLQ